MKVIFCSTNLIISFTLFSMLFSANSFGQDISQGHRIRYTINDYQWKFKREEVQNGHKTALNDKDWHVVNIPHDYNGGSDGKHFDVFMGRFNRNDTDKRMMYKGPGWYRVEFFLEEKFKDKRIFIEFEAVSLEARVWVNGKFAGVHQGGYTAFSLDITDLVQFGKPNLLAVRADNSNNPRIAPWMADEKKAFPYSFDYAIYGGIYRDVWLTVTDPVKIERVFNTPACGGQAPASLSIETRVKNYSKKAKEVELVSEIFDPDKGKISTLSSKKIIPAGQELVFSQFESAFGDVRYWDPANPELYRVHSKISYDGKPADAYESIFGFRYFTLANHQAFSLNGEKIFLRGVNRHQDMEGYGYALPDEQHFNDARIIREAGFNFVRHAHYPCDQAFHASLR
jgi:beta-galactosidase